jgi:aspartyl-tRNA(Asn)/glutamyl-tRNA(Gln) amidotransferase subunit A
MQMLTLLQSADQIRTRKLSPVELTRECLDRIDRLNPTLNAFITVTHDLALAQARRAEEEIAAGNYRGPLHGIPIALKDNIDTAGILTTAASNQYRDRIPTEDAEIVNQLKLAGAIIIGKTNMHEFAFGGSGIISAFGPARNPIDPTRITGGSSSGTAAAVGAGMCVAAIGTDTAGSVRCPAALCGVVGHRPSQGLLSNAGIIPLAESFDTPGPITQTVEDARIILAALAPVGSPAILPPLPLELTKLRIGVARNLAADLETDIASCFERAVQDLVKLVAYEEDIHVAVQPEWDVRNFEIFRYHQSMFENSPQLYDPRTLDRVRGTAGVSEIDYIRKREALKNGSPADALFANLDVVLSPTVPVSAPLLSELEAMDSTALRAYEMKSLLRNTIPFSFLWWPSISVPCGFTSAGLPIGLQISGRPRDDQRVLQFAMAYEQAAGWHKPALPDPIP